MRILLHKGISKALCELRFTPMPVSGLFHYGKWLPEQPLSLSLPLCDTVRACSDSSGILLILPVPDFHPCFFYSSFCCFTVLCSFCINPLSTLLKVCWRTNLLLKLPTTQTILYIKLESPYFVLFC